MNSPRKYELKKRADEMERTRQRITEAAVHLHGSVGPARTTISAVAEEAGVQRHTVYRHFPTEEELYGACSSHYFSTHPLPDIEPWRGVKDPRERLTHALGDLYAYYEDNVKMFGNVFRDLELVDALKPTMIPMEIYLGEVVDLLGRGWGARGRARRLLVAALGHVLDFRTWRSLTADGQMSREEAVRLTSALVEAAVRGIPR